MIAVIFEVTPHQDSKEAYLDIAGHLKTDLLAMEGFIAIERFQSLTDPNRLLSLSFWRDEAAVKAWRNQMAHRDAQQKGRNQLFKDYRIRVASVLRDYSMEDRQQVPVE